MKFFKKLLRDRRGVSMTEVIVAMAAVLIVTGAAITVLVSSSQADTLYRDKYRALNGCENAVECIRFTKDKQTLADALLKAGFSEIPVPGTDEVRGDAPEGEGDPLLTQPFRSGYEFVCGDKTVTVKIVTDENTGVESYVVTYCDDDIYTVRVSG